MEKFKVGDKVKVKPSAKVGDVFNGIEMHKSMITTDKLTVKKCYPKTAENTVMCSDWFYYGQDALTKVK